jgi:hypothetical protein
MKTLPRSILLNALQMHKLKTIQKSLVEPKTFEEILDGLLNVGYTTALRTLYEDGIISRYSYLHSKQHLPDYLQDALPK